MAPLDYAAPNRPRHPGPPYGVGALTDSCQEPSGRSSGTINWSIISST